MSNLAYFNLAEALRPDPNTYYEALNNIKNADGSSLDLTEAQKIELAMEEAGVTDLNVAYKNQNYTDENGNQHKQAGSFASEDGTIGQMTDVWFKDDLSDTQFMDEIEVNADIAKLPDLKGYGNMPSLQQAMALD